MPRRSQPQIPAAPQRVPRAPDYRVANEIPRRGWSDATVWVDTGVLLFAGTDADLLDRVRARFGTRARVAVAVDREVRHLANRRPNASEPLTAFNRHDAASAAVTALLMGPQGLPVSRLSEEELELVEPVKQRLDALSNERKKHGGEAELIVLASRAAARKEHRHVVLTNDSGASIVAGEHHLPSRHAGDVLAELACCNHDLDCDTCWRRFEVGHAVSGIAYNARPRSRDDFRCNGSDGHCEKCDDGPVAAALTG